jgi:S1-C subfamily serine protease
LGIQLRELSAEARTLLSLSAEEGILVDGVVAGGPADSAGIRRMDIILAVDEEKLGSVAQWQRYVRLTAPGQKVQVFVLRRGERIVIPVVLGAASEPDSDEFSRNH